MALLKGKEEEDPMVPQDFNAEQSSIISNMATGNSLESSVLHFGACPYIYIYIWRKYSLSVTSHQCLVLEVQQLLATLMRI